MSVPILGNLHHRVRAFNSHSGYYSAHPYFDTSLFKNIKTDDKGVTRMRIGVLGDKHAAIRFTSVSTNSETSMTEIALAHYDNTRTDIRKFSRTIPTSMNPINLGAFHLRDVMNIYKPLMMTVAIHRGGRVTVTKDGEIVPFLQFDDPSFSSKYVGFCKWDVPVVFFYDCPLLPGGTGSAKGVPATGTTFVFFDSIERSPIALPGVADLFAKAASRFQVAPQPLPGCR
ncbi:conserved hypothetical protein [Culex quinquefasciatus]|uniref:Farnesoic acid O-methyl transferase domain-containing protein n=1 Tax=Culex quinquefasciatus TaxID=7176 RepID=B0WIE1_CULQU|nr:conserved hypothetical protein [Culex quinquefasciatus]|eukprot:XP_001848475.1 conserved hypothetical protein [Culex quinquefasciatus]